MIYSFKLYKDVSGLFIVLRTAHQEQLQIPLLVEKLRRRFPEHSY